MLTLAGLRKYQNYNDLVAALNKGAITEKDLRKVYSSFRKQIMGQIKTIQKSDIKFLPGTAPTMRKVANIITSRDLVHEIATGLRFYHSRSYTRKQRVEQRQKAVEALSARGIDIPLERWDEWRQFMQWFYHTEYSALYDSDSDAVQEVFEQGSNAHEWERAFKEWKLNYG